MIRKKIVQQDGQEDDKKNVGQGEYVVLVDELTSRCGIRLVENCSTRGMGENNYPNGEEGADSSLAAVPSPERVHTSVQWGRRRCPNADESRHPVQERQTLGNTVCHGWIGRVQRRHVQRRSCFCF